MREGETKKWKRLVFTVMADEREPDRFCLVAHLSSFSPVSGFFRDAPIFVLSFSGHNLPFLNHHDCSSPALDSHNICGWLSSPPL